MPNSQVREASFTPDMLAQRKIIVAPVKKNKITVPPGLYSLMTATTLVTFGTLAGSYSLLF
jgi:hypothetical protein